MNILKEIDDYIAAVQPLIDDGRKKYDRDLAQEYFEQKITEEENPRAPTINLGRKAEILIHGESRETDIHAVKKADRVERHHERYQPSCDLGEYLVLSVHRCGCPQLGGSILLFRLMAERCKQGLREPACDHILPARLTQPQRRPMLTMAFLAKDRPL